MKKTLILMTKSYKYGGYCISGVDPRSGAWIRLVSSKDPSKNEIPKALFEPFRCLDILEVGVTEAVPYGCQTENFLLDPALPPTRVGVFPKEKLLTLCPKNTAAGIFGNSRSHLTEFEIARQGYSLMACPVQDLSFDYYADEVEKWHFRCSFRYGGLAYSDISVTDPVFRREAYAGEGFARAILVVSLPAIPYSNGFYYKFVAKIFPLPTAEAQETEAVWTESEDTVLGAYRVDSSAMKL